MYLQQNIFKNFLFKKPETEEQLVIRWIYGIMVFIFQKEKMKFIDLSCIRYIEVWYHKEYNVIRKFRTFNSTDEPLKPYLNKIKLPKF